MNDPERLDLPSASNEAFWNCAGQRNLMKACGYPKEPSNPDADRGTKLHTALETGNTLELDEEQEETYKQGLKFLQLLIQDWVLSLAEPNMTVGWKEGPREERMWIRNPDTLEPIASAKLDRHYISGEDGFAIDFKGGFVPNLSPSPRSTQLRIQALALKSEHPELRRIRVAFDKAKLRYGADDKCDYNHEDLVFAERWMMQHLWLSRQPDAPRTPGSHCDYCPCKAHCREAAAYSMLPSVIASNAVQKSDFDPVEAVSQMTAPDLVKIWQSSTLITKVLDAVKSRLKSMPDEALAAFGIERGKGKEYNTVTDIKGAISILQMRGWDTHKIYDCMEFSNTKLAKQARVEKGLPSEKAATAWVKTTLADAITRTESEKPLRLINE